MAVIRAKFSKKSLQRTLKALKKVNEKIANQSVKKGVGRGGKLTHTEAKSQAPRGKTKLFSRTLSRRQKTYDRVRHISVVGQRLDRHFGNTTKRAARRRNFGLSTGISGSGLVTPIHLVENRTRPHNMPRKPGVMSFIPRKVLTRAGGLRTGGRRDIVHARKIRHPGKRAQRFLAKTAQAVRKPVARVVENQLKTDLRSLRAVT